MIREACRGDAEVIASLINESNYHAYKNLIPREYFRHPVVSSEEILRDMGRMNFYVYELGGEVVGVAALMPRFDEGVGIVRWVYVHPRFWRRGIGTALMKRVEKEARALGLRKLRLKTLENAWAVNFYLKLGFVVKEYIERPGWRDVVMEKVL